METIKIWWILGCILCLTTYGTAQYINEFHYDNDGGDVGEFVEIAFVDPQPADLADYRIYLYNGGDSMVQASRGLQNLPPACFMDTCYYVWFKSSIQNDTEGIAFVYVGDMDTMVLDFISYEGTIEALDGPALGMVSEDVGVMEDDSTQIGWSLQLDEGVWIAGPATPGSVNPIELQSFSGKYLAHEKGVLLEWITASELNNQYFEIQRSSDQISYMSIASVEGALNSQEALRYSYFDADPLPGRSYYRLKQVDLDGNHTYSAVIEVNCPVQNSLSGLIPVFQNQEMRFLHNGYLDLIDITIYDNRGRMLVFRKNINTTDVIPLDVPGRGIIYFLIQSGDQIHSGPLISVTR